MLAPISYTSDGFYVVRVDTGIGEQYAVLQIIKPTQVLPGGGAINWNALDGFSSHYKFLVAGPAATPEAAMSALATARAVAV